MTVFINFQFNVKCPVVSYSENYKSNSRLEKTKLTSTTMYNETRRKNKIVTTFSQPYE